MDTMTIVVDNPAKGSARFGDAGKWIFVSAWTDGAEHNSYRVVPGGLQRHIHMLITRDPKSVIHPKKGVEGNHTVLDPSHLAADQYVLSDVAFKCLEAGDFDLERYNAFHKAGIVVRVERTPVRVKRLQEAAKAS